MTPIETDIPIVRTLAEVKEGKSVPKGLWVGLNAGTTDEKATDYATRILKWGSVEIKRTAGGVLLRPGRDGQTGPIGDCNNDNP